jgi:hypothetical protein
MLCFVTLAGCGKVGFSGTVDYRSKDDNTLMRFGSSKGKNADG